MPNKITLGSDISLFNAISLRNFYREILTTTRSAIRHILEKFQNYFTSWWNRRQTIAALEALDPRMLQDVGLTGMNIRDFVNDPNNADPRLRV